MKVFQIIFFLFLLSASSLSQITPKQVSDLSPKENNGSDSNSSSSAYPVFSVGLYKQLNNININNEANPFMFNLGFQLFFKLKPEFGLVTGIDANKYTGGGIFLHLSFVPHFRVNSGNGFQTFLGVGLTGGLIANENSDNKGITGGYLVSLKVEKKIKKYMALSFDLKMPHYILSNQQFWSMIFNIGIILN